MNKNIRPGYFLEEHDITDPLHGGICNKDAEKVMAYMGLTAISFPKKNSFSFWAKLLRVAYLFKTLMKLPSGAFIVFQFPIDARMGILLLKKIYKRKDIKMICFIADIDGLKDKDEKLLRQEKKLYNLFDLFIVHNPAMEKWVRQFKPKAKISMIEFFDYFVSPVKKEISKTNEIVFAGNLAKSPFINELHHVAKKCDLKFYLYGEGINFVPDEVNIKYFGIEKPYELPEKITGSFGLIWEGDSINDTTGKLGEYVQHITNHKLSLYIICGLPLIVPVKSGSAFMVNKYKIGFTVNNLFEIKSKLDQLSEKEYQQMRDNMKPVAEKISSGKYLRGALAELIDGL